MFIADPWGETRDDLRAAIQTRRIVATASVPSKCEDEDYDALRFYLKHNQPQPQFIPPEEIKRLVQERLKK